MFSITISGFSSNKRAARVSPQREATTRRPSDMIGGCSWGSCIRSAQVGQAVIEHELGARLRLASEPTGQAHRGDLELRAEVVQLDELRRIVGEPGVALGVGDDRPPAGDQQLVDDRARLLGGRLPRQLEQRWRDPARDTSGPCGSGRPRAAGRSRR
jgi:hypothetical protein